MKLVKGASLFLIRIGKKMVLVKQIAKAIIVQLAGMQKA
jgi:hypothetical protein